MSIQNRYARHLKHSSTKLIFILTEGSKREPQYFDKFSRLNTRVHFEIIERTPDESNCPEALLRKAEAFKRNLRKGQDYDFRPTDEFWIVIDVDSWSKIKELIQSANSKKWQVAISNPCFEVWLYFHHFASLPTESYEAWSSQDWKEYLGRSVEGGFNSAIHFSNFAAAYYAAKDLYVETDGIPNVGCTSVYLIFRDLIGDNS